MSTRKNKRRTAVKERRERFIEADAAPVEPVTEIGTLDWSAYNGCPWKFVRNGTAFAQDATTAGISPEALSTAVTGFTYANDGEEGVGTTGTMTADATGAVTLIAAEADLVLPSVSSFTNGNGADIPNQIVLDFSAYGGGWWNLNLGGPLYAQPPTTPGTAPATLVDLPVGWSYDIETLTVTGPLEPINIASVSAGTNVPPTYTVTVNGAG